MRIKHKGLRRLAETGSARGIDAAMEPTLINILTVLDTAAAPGELDNPGWRLHPLKGSMAGHWSVRVTGNWRVTFRFEDNEAVDVNLVDYH